MERPIRISIFVQVSVTFSVRWWTSLGTGRLFALFQGSRVQLRCEPTISLRVEMFTAARAQIIACLCFNSK